MYLYNLRSCCSENPELLWLSYFSISFFWRYLFLLKRCFFNCIIFLCLLLKGMLYCKQELTECYPKPLNNYQCHWLPRKRKVLLCSASLELFLSCSSQFFLVIACSGSFCFWQAMTCPPKLTYIFIINKRHVRFYYKVGQALLQTVTPWMYYKVAQSLLKNVVDFSYYKVRQVVLQSREGITKWGRYFKTGQLS